MCDHPNRESAMTVIECDETGTPTIWCDPCIAPLVAALNVAGFRTVASCCGHNHGPARISLVDGREVFIADFGHAEVIQGALHDELGCKSGRECDRCAERAGAS